jgi:hypothetical protein
MLAQRELSLAMGYEDLNDHDPLWHDRLVELIQESHREAPKEIVLDLEVTDTAIRDHQEGRFFHGFHGHYCYLPLYLFCGQHLLCARLREANQDASAGSLEELERAQATTIRLR